MESAGSSNFVSAGTTTVDANGLDIQSNNSYTFIPGLTNPTGITYGSDVQWTADGGNGFSAINETVNIGWPEVGKLTSSTTIDNHNDYTLSVQSLTNSHATIFQIAGPDGNVLYELGPNVTSHTFTAAELASIGRGTAIFQVTGYKVVNKTIDGKNVYAVNETVVSEFGTID